MLCKQNYELTNYWQNILKGIVSVMEFMTECGLLFCGDDGSPKNGIYLGKSEEQTLAIDLDIKQ